MNPDRTLSTLLVLLAWTLPAGGQEPVGAIVAWHRDLPGTPALPAGWAELAGQTHVEPGSPFHNLLLPDLNGATGNSQRRFLRGARTSGILQDDKLQGHAHKSFHSGTDGRFYNLCPYESFQDVWSSTYSIGTDPAPVTVLGPTTDFVNGTPRVDDETRPVNMSVAWVLKTSQGELPVGAIVAWHRDHPALSGTPLGAGWAACDGGVLSDPLSPYHGLALPELNASERFLRGGQATGVLEADALQDHRHSVTHDLLTVSSAPFPSGNLNLQRAVGWRPYKSAHVEVLDPRSDSLHGTPRVASETRPVNMSVVWILKTRAGAMLPPGALLAYHDDPGAGLPPLASGKPDWYECEGQTVRTPGSPYRGAVVPDLNVARRFLRGGATSGVLQADAFQGHRHAVAHDTFTTWSSLALGGADFTSCGGVFYTGSLSVGIVTNARVANETRPDNMHVPWILYLPGGDGLRPGIAPRPPRSAF